MEEQFAASAFAALSQDTRLAILRALVRAGTAGVTPSALAAQLSVPAPTLSFHLKALASAGLICARRHGRNLHYAPDYAGLRRLVLFLMEGCCQGDPRLCGPYVLT